MFVALKYNKIELEMTDKASIGLIFMDGVSYPSSSATGKTAINTDSDLRTANMSQTKVVSKGGNGLAFMHSPCACPTKRLRHNIEVQPDGAKLAPMDPNRDVLLTRARCKMPPIFRVTFLGASC